VSAQSGRYAAEAFAETPENIRRRYFSDGAPHAVRPEIKVLCRFERRDVISEPAPAARFHLIVCRNVLIYFDRATQERLFVKFHEALAPSGFIVLGKVETLFGEARSLFTAIDARDRIFRKA
jgi:chemotaxis methyl-accepting protein methylase